MEGEIAIVVREFDSSKDVAGVLELERRCEVGPSGKLSLFTNLLGDPICRVRNSPAYLILVADLGGEIVGIIRGSIKTVTCGKKLPRPIQCSSSGSGNNSSNSNSNSNDSITKPVPVYTKAAYILGLRVSPSHRRMGLGLKLVSRIEGWFRQNGAEYAYLATENENQASIKLFTDKCGYSKFRNPYIMVNPVFAHRVSVSKRVNIIKLFPREAELLYRLRFSTTEFFPRDIDSVLINKLSLGTFLAVPRGTCGPNSWNGLDSFLSDPPESWAILSVWNCKEVYTLEVRGLSRVMRTLVKATRVVDNLLPFLRLPSIPDVFRPFGVLFLYGLGGEGSRAAQMVEALCGYAHNLAKESGCAVVAAEVSSCDPLRFGIPFWKILSINDVWCIKRLQADYSDGSVGDWTKSPSDLSIFVDPREI